MPRRIISVPDRSYLCHSDTRLNSTMPLRLNALLCRSYTCPCQCSATPLVCYSMPKQSAPLLCPSMATLRFAPAPFFFATPLLRYARLDLSVQCLSDTILVIATTKRYLSTPLLSLSSQCPRFARLCHRLNVLYGAHALKLTAMAIHRYSMPLPRLSPLCLFRSLPFIAITWHC